MSENKEEIYKDFLRDLLSEKNNNITPPPLLPTKKRNDDRVESDFIPKSEKTEIKIKNNIVNKFEDDKSKYEEIFISDLPMGEFYFPNTKIYIRPCTVHEIQNFSTFDTRNPFDFKNKLNDILETCVIFENADGTYSSHLDLYDGDRVWLIYTIREKTFPKGKILSANVTYEDKDKEKRTHKIDLIRANIELWREQNIMKYFNTDKKIFEIDTTLKDTPFLLAPPTIGLRNCFDQYMDIKVKTNSIDKQKDSPFFKIAPYLKPRVSYMSLDELEEFERWFKEDLTPDEYFFLYDLINNHLKIGIRGLKKNMGSTTLRTYKLYPDNYRTLFLLPNAFDVFVKK